MPRFFRGHTGRTETHCITAALLAAWVILLSGCPSGPGSPSTGAFFRGAGAVGLPNTPAMAAAAALDPGVATGAVVLSEDGLSLHTLTPNAGGSFTLRQSYTLAAPAVALAVADFDQDTLDDVALLTAAADSILIMRSLGAGVLEEGPIVGLESGTAPTGILAADLDADLFPDLITTDSVTDSVSVVLNGVGGGFFTPASYGVGGTPGAVIAADINNDGFEDIITANTIDDTLGVLPGVGDGTFGAVTGYPAGTGPVDLLASDVNLDNIPDLVVANRGDESLSVFEGAAAGTLADPERIGLDAPPMRLISADFSRDGFADIGVGFGQAGAPDAVTGTLEIFRSTAAAGLASFSRVGLGGNAGLQDVGVDSAGMPLLIGTDPQARRLTFVRMRDNGVLDAEIRLPVGLAPRVVQAVDVNNDQRLDLIASSVGDDSISIYHGDGRGGWTSAPGVALQDPARDIAATDLDGDGVRELITANVEALSVSIYPGLRGGGYRAPTRYSVLATPRDIVAAPRSLAIGDVDNDGIDDIVSGNSGADSISVLYGDGEGGVEIVEEYSLGNFPLAIKLVNLNDDENLDLVFLSTRDPQDRGDGALPRVVRVLGAEEGGFDETTLVRYATGPAPYDLAVADLDGNGNQDVVTVHPQSELIYLLLGRADGSFAPASPRAAVSGANSVALDDLTGNGLPDIILTRGTTPFLNSDAPSGIAVLRNQGNGLFNVPVTQPAGSDPIGGITADINGDGLPDFIAANRNANDILVLAGR